MPFNLMAANATRQYVDLIWKQNEISSDLTLSAGRHSVEEDITVDDFGVLTLQPGAVLKFSPNTLLLIASAGRLV